MDKTNFMDISSAILVVFQIQLDFVSGKLYNGKKLYEVI